MSGEKKAVRILIAHEVPPLLRGRYAEAGDSFWDFVLGGGPQTASAVRTTHVAVHFWAFREDLWLPDAWLAPVAPDEVARQRYVEALRSDHDLNLIRNSISSALEELGAVEEELPNLSNPHMVLLHQALKAQDAKDLLELPWRTPLPPADQKSLMLAWDHLKRAVSSLAAKEQKLIVG